ncbi:class I SAM-dependent methyltransferase [Labrys wisconsinensis]|uniref:SAM-dependent MidA family methyltransferase n=1 Tax=Labrys wisconsinensis TaxID=425677 RepID=A0ABU0JHC6_9HYPH|nr:SAM-dependent methyltransferase [Labrys wisconsinensis]MDQ0473693.1 SAM-dependent MidA family methyltransferase [Labrys wisconsinensis]
MTTPLGEAIASLVRDEGPIDLARFMALALGHPVHGYYRTRDPLGAAGDFTTAPEISQMFGELVGLWAAHAWQRLGRPDPVLLAELGPGRGTLMADALRAVARAAPDFLRAARLHLVETSPVLRQRQADALAGHAPAWHEATDTLPDGPLILIANEFFDALPVRQFQRRDGRWHERLVGLAGDRLAFGLAAGPAGIDGLPEAPDGAILELGEAGLRLAGHLAARLARDGGAALILDYGHIETGFGDTLQAMRRHAGADPLAEPGEADLTTHVDFAALAAAAAAAGARIDLMAGQADFLEGLGIRERAAALKRRATPAQVADIDAALARLTDRGRTGMGALFKVLALSG